jgi:hypothetical protein
MSDSLVKSVKKGVRKAVMDMANITPEVVSAFLGHIGLTDKPTSVESVQRFRPDITSSLSLADGLDGSEYLAMSPSNQVSNDPRLFKKARDYNLFSNYKRLPTLIKTGTWTGADTAGTRLFSMPVTPTYCHTYTDSTLQYFELTHVGNLASNFVWWTGGIDLCFTFFTSKFITGRLCLKALTDPTYTGAIANDEFGDTVSHMMDITADTIYTVRIPWLQDRSWLKVPDPYKATTAPVTEWGWANGQVTLQVVNPLVVGDSEADAVVYYAVWMSGAPDFRVAQPIGLDEDIFVDGTQQVTAVKDGKQEKEKYRAQSKQALLTTNIRALYEMEFATMIPTKVRLFEGVTMGEEVSSWTEYFRRYMLKRLFTNTGSNSYALSHDPRNWTIGGSFTPFDRFLRTFHFNRGGFRYKLFITRSDKDLFVRATNDNDVIDNAGTQQDGILGYAVAASKFRPCIEVQTPYYYDYDMNCQSQILDENLNNLYVYITLSNATDTSSVNCTAELWLSLGDDFSVGWPVCPVKVAKSIALKKQDTGALAREFSMLGTSQRKK